MTIRTLIKLGGMSGLAAILIALSLGRLHTVAAGEPVLWRVTFVEGQVQVRTGQDTWTDVQSDQALPPGSHVTTGVDGRVTLSHGGDEIAAGPGTDFTVSGGGGDEPYSVMQSMGRMLFRMESRATRDFSVGTPYLAAAIKGTTFTVDVETKGASVSVDEGTVEVTVAATGETVMVDRGGSVAASDRGMESVTQSGAGPADASPVTDPEQRRGRDGDNEDAGTQDENASSSAVGGVGTKGADNGQGQNNTGAAGSSNGQGQNDRDSGNQSNRGDDQQ